MKCREKGKFELAMKLIDKYKIDKEKDFPANL